MAADAWPDALRQIQHLVAEYSERVDSGDLDGVADLLAAAGFGTATGPLVTGRENILGLYRQTVRIYDDGTPRTRHLVTNLVVDVDESGSSATARSYWTVMQAPPGKSIEPILCGRYRDRFTFDGARWSFSERRIVTDLVGDAGGHLLPGGPALS